MARKFQSTERFLLPDPKFGSRLLSKFINTFMYEGKKSIAQRVVYDALGVVADRVKEEPPIEVFNKAIENVKPMVEVRPKRVGGANYQVPMEVNSKRRQSLAFRWIIQSVRGGKGKPTAVKLADELIAAYKREGSAMKTRETVHRMAEANKAFAHFAW
ncbi:MAG: 30S ribosomal protein S7 [Planctomycetes bacterium]|nr:30S ribosomal protein S7 [Planctomycetota bacterium]